ncbi:hypothetical protein CONPUDRAFT_77005 [Coniophora puteana RWD-64-598 SS2]|uniref:Uncharacterized protein n=1 Tax=Coniophora puteana (strain RWD-64-598) TaxID=741705 RepID=A0A5M3MA20_CONPW|nr:uncharacterized protein CONPUDRAFT_77005 [Coniophora puteana RWD-64-598 SS2]EIW75973.1 hypothetical protein CONPUDRAFT_77005 [Coniophora puteana RWD-64-598 SS2]
MSQPTYQQAPIRPPTNGSQYTLSTQYGRPPRLDVPECILYGAFSIFIVLDAYIIATRREHNDAKGNRPVLIVVSLMYIVATVHIVSTLCEINFGNMESAQLGKEIWRFVRDKGTSSLEVPSKLGFEIASMEVVQTALFSIQLWLGDGFMITSTMKELVSAGGTQFSCPLMLRVSPFISAVRIAMNAMPSLIGITFSIIIVRMGLGVSAEKYLKVHMATLPLAFAVPEIGDIRANSAELAGSGLSASFNEFERGCRLAM